MTVETITADEMMVHWTPENVDTIGGIYISNELKSEIPADAWRHVQNELNKLNHVHYCCTDGADVDSPSAEGKYLYFHILSDEMTIHQLKRMVMSAIFDGEYESVFDKGKHVLNGCGHDFTGSEANCPLFR